MINAAYDLLFILPLVLAGYSGAYSFIVPQDETVGLIRYLLPVLITAVCLSYKHMKNKGRIIISAVLLTGMLGFFLNLPAGERLKGLGTYEAVFELALICFGLYLAGELFNRSLKLRCVVSGLMFLALPISMVCGYTAGKMCSSMVLLYLLLNLTDLYQYVSNKEGDTGREKHLCFVAPFILGAFLVIAIIPVSEKPYDWAIVRRIGGLVKEAVIDLADRLFVSDEGGEAFIGFSGRGTLNGKIKKNDSVSLILNTMNGNDQNLYIAGRYFNEFNGRSWENGFDTDKDESRMDAVETVCAAMEDTKDGRMTDVIMKISLDIYCRDKRLKNLFIPSKAYVIREDEEKPGRAFKTAYYKLNRRNDIFAALIDRENDIDSTSWDEACKELGIKDGNISYEAYLSYRNNMNERYGESTAISEKMKVYMDELFEGADSDYEKCCRIEESLREGRYSNEPGELPENINDAASYLDWFMFEKKEGYCSHYATAFVLLARSSGMKARYVQGFMTKLNSIGDSEVHADAAHAWAEVYFEGVGWIGFEPTPGYGSRKGWKTYAEIEAEKSEVERKYADPHQGEGEESEEPGIEGAEENKKIEIPWEKILIPVFSGAVLALILFIADGMYKRKKYRAMSEKEKCLFLCRQYLHYFRRIGCTRDEYETLGEFRTRASEISEDKYLAFLDIYERLLYADENADEGRRKELEAMKKPLCSYIKERKKELKRENTVEDNEQILDF